MATGSMGTAPATVLDALAGAGVDVGVPGPGDHVGGVPAAAVARPADTAGVSAVMRAARQHDLAVVVRGAGTKLGWGRPPARVDVLLDVSRLSGVLDHASGDLVVHVRAGTPLAEVQAVTGTARQRLVIDETVPGATIGGTIATAASGPLRVAAGTVRDLLIGITLVRADGTVSKAGGRVVKNVAGYDLCKLVTGSYGTLGVLTEAYLRLHPVPAAVRYLTVTGPAAALVPLASRVVHSQLVAAAVEVDAPASGPAALTVLIEGSAAGVEARAAAAAALLPDAVHAESPPPGWSRYPWEGHDQALALKLTSRLSAVGDLLAVAASLPHPPHVRGSAGAGVLYAALPVADPAAAVAEVAALRAAAARAGGTLVVLAGPTEVLARVDQWGPVPGLDLMRRVKHEFDPGGQLAPGRFVGGI